MLLAWLHDPRVVDDQSTAVLPDALRACGWTVSTADTNQIRLTDDGVRAPRTDVAQDLAIGAADLVWLAGFGAQGTCMDRMQLLAGLGVSFVNPPQQLVMLHGKLALHGVAGIAQPETLADTDGAALWAHVQRSGGRWVAKPPGGSRGRDVFVLEAGLLNGPAILEHLTDGGRRMALLQRWVPEAADGELRVLLAAGEVVGCYRRRAAAGEHRNNLHRGGAASVDQLTTGQQTVVAAAARALDAIGLRWVGLDLAGEQVLEANIAAPGGLGTLAALGDAGAAARAATAITRWWRAGPAAGC